MVIRRTPFGARALEGRERRAEIGNLGRLGRPLPGARPTFDHIGKATREAHYLRATLIERAQSFATRSIMLKTRRSQASEAMLIDRPLPGGEFIGREHVAVAGLFKRKHALANSVDDLGLATDHPSLRRDRRQIRRLRTRSIMIDYVFAIRMMRHIADTPIFILTLPRTDTAFQCFSRTNTNNHELSAFIAPV
jgi:hypothetical protein